MAGDVLQKLVVQIGGDTSDLQKSMDDADTKVGGFGDKLKGMGPLAASGGALAGAAILGIGAASLNAAGDFASAQGKMQAQLGITAQEAESLGQVAKDVFKGNFGDSISDATDAVTQLRRQFPNLDDGALRTATENAFRLRDAFGVDINESVDATKTLMEQFGLTSEQAFDLVTAGFQNGLDRSGDFLDTINEYSTQFSSGGASAEEFFGLIQSGAQGGMLGVDRAADAFKEFRVRIQDGSTLTRDSLNAIGLSAEDIATKMADGSMTAADAFKLVTDALRNTSDENVRMQAGVGLLGTQFEDLGTKGATNLTLIGDGFTDVAGKTKDLDVQYTGLGQVFEAARRKALVDWLIPMGDKLTDFINVALPLFQEGWSRVSEVIDALFSAFESGNYDVFKDKLKDLVTDAGEILGEMSQRFWDWAQEMIPPFLVEVGKIALAFGEWFANDASPLIVRKLGEWTLAFLAWAVDMIPPLLEKMNELAARLGSWIVETGAPELATKLKEWGKKFLEWVGTEVLPYIGSKLGDIVKAIADWVVNTGAPRVGIELQRVGKAVIQGLIDGIDSMLDALRRKLSSVTELIPDWKGPEERDRMLLFDSGRLIMAGLMDGIDSQVPALQQQLAGITGGIQSMFARQITGARQNGTNQGDWYQEDRNYGGVRGVTRGSGSSEGREFETFGYDFMDDYGFGQAALDAIEYDRQRGLGRFAKPHAGGGFIPNYTGLVDMASGRMFGTMSEPGTGGEWISPAKGGGGGSTNVFHFPNYVGNRRDLARTLTQATRDNDRRGVYKRPAAGK